MYFYISPLAVGSEEQKGKRNNEEKVCEGEKEKEGVKEEDRGKEEEEERGGRDEGKGGKKVEGGRERGLEVSPAAQCGQSQHGRRSSQSLRLSA